MTLRAPRPAVLVLLVGAALFWPALRPRVEARDDAPSTGNSIVGSISHYIPRSGARVDLYEIPARRGFAIWAASSMEPRSRTALVDAWLGRGRPEAQAVASGLGEFAFTDVDPGLYVLRFEDGEGSSDLAMVEVPLLGGDVHANLRARTWGPRLEGMVRGPGRTQANRYVLLVESGNPGDLLEATRVYGPARVAADGAFVLERPTPGQYLFALVTEDGAEWYVQPISLPMDRKLVVEPPRLTREVRGSIVAGSGSGSPVRGSLLFSAQSDRGRWGDRSESFVHSVSVAADAAGRFKALLPALPSRVRVEIKGRPLHEQAVPTGVSDLKIKLPEGGTLLVTTLAQATGKLVAGVRVCAASSERGGLFVFRVALSGSDGVARFDHIPAGNYAVWPCDPTWAARARKAEPPVEKVPLTALVVHGGKETVTLQLDEASAVRCKVVDASGAVAPGAWVRAWDPAWMSWLAFARPHRMLRADAEGRVTMSGFAQGSRLRLTAVSDGGGVGQSDLVTIRAGGSVDVRIALAPPKWLHVHVFGEDGKDIPAGGWITWSGTPWDEEPHLPRGAQFLIEGRARIGPLTGAPVYLTARAPGFLLDSENLESVPATSEEAPFKLSLDREKRVTGRVVLPPNLSRSDVELRQRGGPRSWFADNRFLALDDDGGFEIGGLANQTLAFEAVGFDGDRIWIGEAKATAGAEDVEIRLNEIVPKPESGVWLLRVVDAKGEIVHGFEAAISKTWRGPAARLGHPYVRMRQRRGRAVAWNVREKDGVYFTVWGAHDDGGAPLRLAEAVAGPETGGGGIVEIKLEPERVVHGRMIHASGEPAPNMDVTIARYYDEFKPRMSGFSGSERRSRTDDLGYFVFRRLGHFRYRLTAMPPEGGAGLMRDLAADEDTITWTVPTRSKARIRVLDGEGRPVAGALVKAVEIGEHEFGNRHWQSLRSGMMFGGGQTDADGVADLERIDSDKSYKLLVRPPPSRDDLTGIAVSSFDPAKMTEVRLPPGRWIRGRVETPDGRLLPGVEVTCKLMAGHLSAIADPSDGRFVLRAVPAREVEIRARLAHPRRAGPTVTVGPEAKEVTVTIDTGRQIAIHVDAWDSIERRMERWVPVSWGRRLVRAEIRLTSQNEQVAFSAGGEPNASGIVRFHHLPDAARFTAWGGTTERGECLFAADLAPSEGVVRIALQPGRTVQGRIVLPVGTVVDRVAVRVKSAVVAGSVRNGRNFTVKGVPPGHATVQVWGRHEGDEALEFDETGFPWNRPAKGMLRGDATVEGVGDLVVALEPWSSGKPTDPIDDRIREILAGSAQERSFSTSDQRIEALVALGAGATPHLFRIVQEGRKRHGFNPRVQLVIAALAKLITKADLPTIANLLSRGRLSIARCLRELRSPDALAVLVDAVRAGHLDHDIVEALQAQDTSGVATEAVREWIEGEIGRDGSPAPGIDRAAEYLARLGDYECVPILESAIADVQAGHRRSSLACSLAALGSARGVEELLGVLADKSSETYAVQERRRAAGALQMIIEGDPLPGFTFFVPGEVDQEQLLREAKEWWLRVKSRLRYNRERRRWFVEGDQPTSADLRMMLGAKETRSLAATVEAPSEVKSGEAFKAILTLENSGSAPIKNLTLVLSTGERFTGSDRHREQKSVKFLAPGEKTTFEVTFTLDTPGYHGVDGTAWDRERMVSTECFRVAVLRKPNGDMPDQKGATMEWARAVRTGSLQVRIYTPPNLWVGEKAQFVLEVRNTSNFEIKDCAMQLFAPPSVSGAEAATLRLHIPKLLAGDRFLGKVALVPRKAGEHSLQVRVRGSERRISASCKLDFSVAER